MHFCEDDGQVNGEVVNEYQHPEGKMMIIRIFELHSMIYWRIRRWNDDVEEDDNNDAYYVDGVVEDVCGGCDDTTMVFVGVMMLGI